MASTTRRAASEIFTAPSSLGLARTASSASPFRRDVAVRLGDARRDLPLNMNFTATFVGFTDAGRFQPSNAFLEQLYDKEKLEEVAKAEVAARAQAAAGMDLDDADPEDSEDSEDFHEFEELEPDDAAAGGGASYEAAA